jgi:hypothetical protein
MRTGFESRLRPPRRMPFLEPERALPVVIVASVKGRHPPRQNTRAGCGQERFDVFSTTCTKTQRLTDARDSNETYSKKTLLATSTPASLALSARRSKAASLRGLPIAPLSVGYQRGLRRLSFPSYNEPVMSTVRDAAQKSQFAFARVLAALSSVPAALSGELTFAIAPQPLR